MVDGSTRRAGVLEHLQQRCPVYAPGRQELDRALDHRGAGLVSHEPSLPSMHYDIDHNAARWDRDNTGMTQTDHRRRSSPMPMIDVTATEGTFADPHALAQAVAAAVMSIEQVPDI